MKISRSFLSPRRLAALALPALLAVAAGLLPAPIARAVELGQQDPAGYSSRLDGSGSDEVFDSFSDPAGNVYVVGRTSSVTSTIDVLRGLEASPAGTDGTANNTNRYRFGPDPQQTMTGTAGTYSTRTYIYSLFVIKYDRNGNVVWKRTAAGNPGDNFGGYDYVATGVAADSNGNVFITGSLAGDATFGPFTVKPYASGSFTNGIPGMVQANLFVAMLDRDGNWQWVKLMDVHVSATSGDGKTAVNTLPSDLFQLYLRNGGKTGSAYASVNGGLNPATSAAGRGSNTADGHALALGPDGSVYIKGVVETGTELIREASANTVLFWLNVNGDATDTRPTTRVALGASYGSGSARRQVVYQNTQFLARLKATPAVAGSPTGSPATYAWDWLAPVTSGVIQSPDGGTSDANIDKGISYLFGQGTGTYYGSSTGVIGQIAVDDSSVYLTGHWKGNNVLAGAAQTPVGAQDGFVARLNSSNGLPIYLTAFTTDRRATSAYAGGLTIDGDHNAYFAAAIGNNDTAAVTSLRTRTPTDGGTVNFPLAVSINNQNFFLAKLNPSGDPQWATSPSLSVNSGAAYAWVTSLSRDTAGALYLGGGMYSTTTTPAPNYFTLAGQDVFGSAGVVPGNTAFLLKVVDSGGSRSCLSALQTYAPQFGSADPAPDFDSADVHAGLGGTVYWSVDAGNSAAFANRRSSPANPADNAYDRVTGRGAFLLPVLADTPFLSPTFASFKTVVVGQQVLPPSGAVAGNAGFVPEVYLPGTTVPVTNGFYWDAFGKRLFAISQTLGEVQWRVSAAPGNTARLPAVTAAVWPTPAQGLVTHVTGAGANADEPRVSVEPAGASSTFSSILYSESNAAITGAKLFSAKGEGYSTLLYSAGANSSPISANVSFTIVRSFLWTNAAVRSNDTHATVGLALDQTASYVHNDPEGKNGYVVNRRARIDANGPAAAYSFATQKGPIIPINTEELTTATPPADADPGDDLWVIWSHLDPNGVGWPAQAVRYTASWPTNPEKIIISSQLGSEMEVSGSKPARAILANGTRFTTSDGIPWDDDKYFTGGTGGTNAVTIAGATTNDQRLYQKFRSGASFSYALPVPNGQYRVTLYFAQPAAPTSGTVVKRAVNVSVEGVPVLSNLVPADRAGGVNTAVTVSLPATVADGVLSLVFTAPTGYDEAFVNAILVIPAQERLDPAKFTNLAVYHQPDRNLPGYNPNEEHALIAAPNLPAGVDAGGRLAVFALRNDLNNLVRKTSDAYTLVRYRDATAANLVRFKVYQVLLSDSRYSFTSFPGLAGTRIQPPYPLTLLPAGSGTTGGGTPYFKDRKNQVWAKSDGTLTARYFYGLQPDFWYDTNGNDIPDPGVTNVPWLDRIAGGTVGTPIAVNYGCIWPGGIPVLYVGDTLTTARDGLPEIEQQGSATIIYEQSNAGAPTVTNGVVTNSAVRILPYADQRVVSLPGARVDGTNLSIPGSSSFGLPVEIDLTTGYYRFRDLPFHLKSRLLFAPTAFDPVKGTNGPALVFGGYKDAASYAGRPLLLLNVLSAQEKTRLLNFDASATAAWTNAVNALYLLTRNPNGVDLVNPVGPDDAFLAGFAENNSTNTIYHANALGPKALTAGRAAGTLGYVTLVTNNADSLGALPIDLKLINVQNPPVVGDLKVIFSDNPLDEKITVRHGADFAGDPSALTFDWYYQPANSATSPTLLPPGNGWIALTNGAGINDYTFEGASLTTLADSWVYCRYRGYDANGNDPNIYGKFAGDPSGTPATPRAAFVPGWIKRVLSGINPFEAKVKNFASAPTQTYSSALVSAGTRYEGDVALNNDPANLNSIGLISLYETVLRRGERLSIDGSSGGQTNPAVNQSLLLAASRISDLYMLLGNEAYADAQDPTVGFTSADGTVGSLAPSLFAFQNQVPNLISEELALLRGRDDSSAGVAASPVYNRLYWNFTKGLEGEPVYVQNYGIDDQNSDGLINEKDARILFPQGHGDAWGHYLSAVKSHYRLLRQPLYTWKPNSESALISGVAVETDYLDEQKFAAAAAARATAGAEIVNLTYRDSYTADPAGQWQGYRDADPTRAWGAVEWARRAGQGAFFDWVTANSILPASHAHLLHNPLPTFPATVAPSDPPTTGVVNSEPAPTGLQKIDRTTITDLAKIAVAYGKVQAQMDQADAGLNPLGVTPGTIPFDIDPNFNAVGSTTQNQTHFEQIYNRAQAAINNARGVFDYANALTNRIRQVQLSASDFGQQVLENEHDFNSRLIEVFGYPYAGDIGSAGLYPTGYNGPDLYHYNYVAVNTVSGTSVVPDTTFNGYFSPFGQEYKAPAGGATGATDLQSVYSFYFPADGNPINPVASNTVLTVPFPQATAADWSFAAPTSWGSRRAPGSLQLAIGDIVTAEAALRRGLLDYNNHLAATQDQIDLLFARSGLQASNIQIKDKQKNTIIGLNTAIGVSNAIRIFTGKSLDTEKGILDSVVEAIPKTVGLATDALSPVRGAILAVGAVAATILDNASGVAEVAANALELSKDQVNLSTDLEIQKNDYAYDIQEQLKVIEGMLREDLGMRLDLFNLQQSLTQATQQYQVQLAEGQRVMEEQLIYRRKVAGVTQQNRYQDLAFRNFRNDALQKYRASFDLAARYVYLAATTYDYETVQLGSSPSAGRTFLTDIVRERALGQFDANGNPIVGVNGLSDPLARLSQNFSVLKGRLGINNPQLEAGQFSLRHEKFRLRDDTNEAWQDQLQALRVPDLWAVPEFRRYCRPFAPESAGAQPGLVIPFSADITFGLNFFGLPLGGGDSSYDSSNYATKIRSVGVSFTGYGTQGLASTPRVYLVPAGLDVLRAPDDTTLATRQFDVVDQAIPTPFPVGTSSLQNPNWIPSNDSLDSPFNQIRQFSRFLAHPDNGEDPSQLVGDTRLIGRSVWNTRWLIIIPGGTFLNDPNEGLNTFILGQPTGTTGRDGNGITDIKLFFETYSYSGN